MNVIFRYILIQIKSEKAIKLTAAELADTLRKAAHKFYGDFGLASVSNLNVKLFYDRRKLVIIRASHGPHRFITSIIPLINKAGKELAQLRILYVGATIRQCKKFVLNYNNNVLRKIIGSFNSEAEKKEFIDEVSNSLIN